MSGHGDGRERLLAEYEAELEADPGVRGALARHREVGSSATALRPAGPSWPALLVSFVLLGLSAAAVIVGMRTGIWAFTVAGVGFYPLVIAPLAYKPLRSSWRGQRRLRGL